MFFGAVIGHGDKASAGICYFRSAAANFRERVAGNMHGIQEIFQRCVAIATFKFVFIGKSDGMDDEIQRSPLFFQFSEQVIHAFFVGNVARQNQVFPQRRRQGAHAFFQSFSLISESQLCAVFMQLGRNAPSDGLIISQSQNQTFFPGHQSCGHLNFSVIITLTKKL